jgi:hypothetical protein
MGRDLYASEQGQFKQDNCYLQNMQHRAPLPSRFRPSEERDHEHGQQAKIRGLFLPESSVSLSLLKAVRSESGPSHSFFS